MVSKKKGRQIPTKVFLKEKFYKRKNYGVKSVQKRFISEGGPLDFEGGPLKFGRGGLREIFAARALGGPPALS